MIKIIPKADSYVFASYECIPTLMHTEFRCKCNQFSCQHTPFSTVLIEAFVKLRKLAGNNSIHINSGHRCGKHNIAEGGSKLSHHLLGMALDLVTPVGITLREFENLAVQAGFSYTKIYPQWNVLHVDVRGLD